MQSTGVYEFHQISFYGNVMVISGKDLSHDEVYYLNEHIICEDNPLPESTSYTALATALT